MTNPNYTDITFILDRSGSMTAQTKDVQGGFDSFVAEQKKLDGKCRMTVVQFDNRSEVVCDNVPLDEVPSAKDFYFTRGSTALLDAVGKAINLAGERFRNMKESERPGRVLFVINTDGHENMSVEFDRDTVKSMVKEQETQYDWDFVFIGADFDVKTAYGDFVTKSGKLTVRSKEQLTNGQLYSDLNKSVTTYRSCNVEAKNSVDFAG